MIYHILVTMDGKRGEFLFFAGWFHIVFSLQFLVADPDGALGAGFGWLPPSVDLNELALLWPWCGALAVLISLVSKVLWFPKLENLGYGLIVIPPLFWFIVPIVDFFFFGGPLMTFLRGIGFLGLFGMFLFIAGWDNPVQIFGGNKGAKSNDAK